ncbi:metal-dependent transcriptional regulator [Latilactobacillus sakei]|uniref:metal-dependent transcriptional regulator n=1 Tax=Latilactobacillus sakei TaxID=1599 RepID=UPI000C1A2997|nr:metal-dependent transcriptional regulator [Latilactobacillus sakei]PKX60891.1 metal-dependent transcriptional regulator [Latilactobacillus sakei]PKX70448.1 metal-dependent transcriptional regulator [Latilactobacillus sakei]RFN56647.1 metal-dependent transcriptional regulator [Latilactobacillus sakei]UNC17648.1 metal-dependent transcriptional regulator [Latilactobacillus sakei]
MTPNKEDYLKIIFELGGDAKKVTNKEILAGLNVSAASVTEMVNKLVKENYVKHTPYQGIQLTSEGAREAALLVRNHRLWEVFLVDKLHYQFNTVHPEAEQLEHVTNHDLAERLADFLGHPKRCPHGGIIPNAKGEFEQQSHHALVDLEVGEKAVIERVLDDNDLLKYTLEIGLTVGDTVTLTKVGLFESPITVMDETQQTEIQVGIKAAQHIFVTPIAAD